MPPLSSSTWRSMISEASVDRSLWRARARRMSSCSNSGVRSCTRIVSFSGSFLRSIAEPIYIKTIEIENVICRGMLLFLRLRDQSRWAKLEISL